MSEWKTISIRQELVKENEKVIKTDRFPSISEFVSEGVRLHLEELIHSEGSSSNGQETPSVPNIQGWIVEIKPNNSLAVKQGLDTCPLLVNTANG